MSHDDEEYNFKVDPKKGKKTSLEGERPKREHQKPLSKEKTIKLEAPNPNPKRSRSEMARQEREQEYLEVIQSCAQWRRYGAGVIDIGFILYGIWSLQPFRQGIWKGLEDLLTEYGIDQPFDPATILPWLPLLYLIVLNIILIVIPSLIWEKTPGKYIFGTALCSITNDHDIKFGKIFMREMFYKPLTLYSLGGLWKVPYKGTHIPLHDRLSSLTTVR